MQKMYYWGSVVCHACADIWKVSRWRVHVTPHVRSSASCLPHPPKWPKPHPKKLINPVEWLQSDTELVPFSSELPYTSDSDTGI